MPIYAYVNIFIFKSWKVLLEKQKRINSRLTYEQFSKIKIKSTLFC